MSGIGPITSFDASNLSTQIAGEVRGFDVEAYLSPKEARKNDQFIHFGMAASIQALRDAGLEDGSAALDPERVGCSLGAGIGGIATIESTTESYLKGGPRKVSPFFIPGTIVNMIGGNLSIRYGFKGPNIAIVTACTSATHNIGFGMRMIQYGEADVVVAGGAEFATSPTAMSGFVSARAMTTLTTNRSGRAVPGMWTGMVSCCRTVPACCCWKSSNMRGVAALASMPSS